MTGAVPFGDLYKQYLNLKPELDDAISRVIKSSAFIRGEEVDRFEEEFATALGAKHCVSCANGTDALYISMKALGASAGDEVITTAHSWISTSASISQTGARVVFCDTSKDSYCIDVQHIENKITDRTVGIVPVHLFGQPANMKAIMELAAKHNLWVVEDCAQSHLATVDSQNTGTIGNAGTFSFYPGKNLGAMGDAGAIVTGDPELATKMAKIARHGGLVKGVHDIEGINSRLDGMQAAILRVKLPKLQEWTAKRRDLAARYHDELAGIGDLRLPTVDQGDHVYHLYVLNTSKRDELRKHLASVNIGTVINYPTALPFLPAYSHMNATKEDYPIAAHNQDRILSIPLYSELDEDSRKIVTKEIVKFYRAQNAL